MQDVPPGTPARSGPIGITVVSAPLSVRVTAHFSKGDLAYEDASRALGVYHVFSNYPHVVTLLECRTTSVLNGLKWLACARAHCFAQWA